MQQKVYTQTCLEISIMSDLKSLSSHKEKYSFLKIVYL